MNQCHVTMYIIQNCVHSFTDFISLTTTDIHVHMTTKCLACESKIAYIFNLLVGSSVGCPPSCHLFPFLKLKLADN